jgi:methionyl-tRNA synthetase
VSIECLTLMWVYLSSPSSDWSREQLEKHAREIMSSVGNLYSRISSKKIQQKVKDAPKRSVQEIARQAPEGSTLHELLSSVDKLGALFQTRMDGLLVADALDNIILTLQKVRDK